MSKHLGPSFIKVKASVYKNHKNGFYVYAKPNRCKPNAVIRYIGRYLGRPVIATSRIDKYDGENVTFHYNRHEDNELITETIPALEFINRLIRHIPEKHFKMIRYYGLYARHRKSDKKLNHAISKEKHGILLSFNSWREVSESIEEPNVEYSQLYVTGKLLRSLPDNSVLHLANSNTIRMGH